MAASPELTHPAMLIEGQYGGLPTRLKQPQRLQRVSRPLIKPRCQLDLRPLRLGTADDESELGLPPLDDLQGQAQDGQQVPRLAPDDGARLVEDRGVVEIAEL